MTLQLVPTPLDIGETDGFKTSDIFHAKATGERLANIVGDLVGHAVIVVDGPWGSGKSVFAKQWAGLLRQQGHAVVYFDAFEHDHLDDAFFPLFGHLLKATDLRGSRLKSARASLIAKATPLVKAMPRIVADWALRSGTGLSLADVVQHRNDAAAGDNDHGDADHIESLIEESVNQAATQVEFVDNFRNALATAVSKTSEGEERRAPLVFVIDELDRCRPSYALNVLERIKHLFATDGICFVLVTHLDGLAAMVRRTYGLEEADRYLDKFFQLRFDIRRLIGHGPEAPHTRYLQHLAQSLDLRWDPNQFTSVTINHLVQLYDLPFRSQECVMLNLALFDRAGGGRARLEGRQDSMGILTLAAGLCVMRNVDRDLYGNAARGRLKYADVMTFLKFEQWTDAWEETIDRIRWFWKMAAMDVEEHLTEDEQDRSNQRVFNHWRRRMAEICADVDQTWQE